MLHCAKETRNRKTLTKNFYGTFCLSVRVSLWGQRVKEKTPGKVCEKIMLSPVTQKVIIMIMRWVWGTANVSIYFLTSWNGIAYNKWSVEAIQSSYSSFFYLSEKTMPEILPLFMSLKASSAQYDNCLWGLKMTASTETPLFLKANDLCPFYFVYRF